MQLNFICINMRMYKKRREKELYIHINSVHASIKMKKDWDCTYDPIYKIVLNFVF